LADVDCSQALGAQGERLTCRVIECPEPYLEFLGTWEGPFASYDQDLQDYRPFANRITYAATDCLEHPASGDRFIIGRRTDTYPEFRGKTEVVKTGLLITGVRASGEPFLRTVDDDGINSYGLQYKSNIASLSIWSLTVTADDAPPMTFTTVDGRDWTAPTMHKRNVVVTMAVGDATNPIWQGVVVRGYHALVTPAASP
jgi:hypothetical protein